jgi:magnesium-transporting ATPase (P-type)
VHEIITRKLDKIVAQIPFSSIRKRSLVALKHPDLEDTVRVYVKGAPEYVINKCQYTLDQDGKRIALDEEQLNHILKDVILDFTTKGLRTIAFAYKDLSTEEFNDLKSECNNFQEAQDREGLE